MQNYDAYAYRCHKRLRELGAPLGNWRCRCVVDGETADFTCDLCDCTKVRYIHVMEHPEYLGKLRVGCVCAGVMEGDIAAAIARDEAAKRKSTRKANFRKKLWFDSGEDFWAVKYKHHEVSIRRDSFRGKDYYKINIDQEQYQWWNNRRIGTLEEAKMCVFEIIDAM